MPWQTLALVAGCAIASWVVVMLGFRLKSRKPAGLGVRDGRLAPCSPTPNCVATQADTPLHHIEPFPFTGSPAEAMARLKTVLTCLPRVRIVAETDTYLYAEFRSRLFRFVDDVEFLIDGTAKVIHLRSASRAGRSDLGVNRRRMEMIRRAFQIV